MLNHLNEKPINPKRVVILGAKGFVGSATVKRLKSDDIEVIAIGRDQIDLTEKGAVEHLVKQFRSDDAVVVVSAKAPCKNNDMLLQNIQMMRSVCDALVIKPVQQVIYISSDAVYADSMGKLSESSPAAPTSLHGVMHLAREHMLQSVVDTEALAILRPSLLYGAGDPHNGYGPNSFYRLALANQSIALFGQGEEQRDHVYIEDVVALISLCLSHRSYGILNITTGDVVSFAEVVEIIGKVTNKSIDINFRPRSGAIPHNGYRAFDNTVCQCAFSNFQYTGLADGLNKLHQVSA